FRRSPLRVNPNRHMAAHALGRHRRFVGLSDVRVLVYVGDSVAAFPSVDGAHVGSITTRRAATAEARSVGTVKDEQPQSLWMGAEVLMEPVPAHWRSADHSHGLVGLLFHLIALSGFPRLHAKPVGPSEAVAFALDADKDRAGRMLVRLRVLPGFVLGDLHVKVCAGHMWLDTPIVEGAPVVGRQLAGEKIGDKVGTAHGESAPRMVVKSFHGFQITIQTEVQTGQSLRKIEK